MLLLTVVFRRIGIFLLAITMLSSIGGVAESAILVQIDGLPYDSSYDTFLIADDVTGLANPRLGIVPKILEFEKDAASGRPKFGVQYDFPAGGPQFASLTTSLRYHQDTTEIRTILAAAETRLGIAAGTMQLSSLNLFTTKISFFVKLSDGAMKTNNLSPTASALSVSYPVVVDLSYLSKSQLTELLKGASPVSGFVSVAESTAPTYQRKNDSGDWEAVITWAESFAALSVRELAFPNHELARSRSDIRISIALALGPPSIVPDGASYVFGWDTTLPVAKARLQKLIDDAKSNGALAKIAEKYQNGSVMPLTNLCSSLGNQIIDISTGNVGCSGL